MGVIGDMDFRRFHLPAFCLVSTIVGKILTFLFSKAPLYPLRELMRATNKIADGNYSVRVNLKDPENPAGNLDAYFR